MFQYLKSGLTALVLVGLAGVVGCADTRSSADTEPQRLADVVVTDPDFDFSTSRTVRLELTAAEGATPRAIEVSDSEGRRLMDGAFKGSATIDLKLPVGRADTLRLRLGSGPDAQTRELAVDGNSHASGSL